MQIDPARRGKMPQVEAPIPLTCENGSPRGWRLRFPGDRPLATVAVADNRVYLGGGFGSYEFYCADAENGSLLWQYQTNDDGPTAAVVWNDYVVFNTESCELEVLTIDGQPVWKKWLGDPLMSMPAVEDGRVFMAYSDTKGDNEHYLACFDVADGRQRWLSRIAGEIITAPVLADDAVYLTTLGGVVCCFSQKDGQLRWSEECNATLSPAVVNGHCYFSQRLPVKSDGEGQETQQTEHCAMRPSRAKAQTQAYKSTSRHANYLDYRKRRHSSPKFAQMAMQDVAVGSAHAKGSSKMEQAMHNLGHGSVAGVWGYQGSKPFIWRGRLYASLGDAVCCLNIESDEVLWEEKLQNDAPEGVVDSIATPPALANDKVFVGTARGELIALSAETGDDLWRERVDTPLDFQLTVSDGRVFAPSRFGGLFCLETGDPQDSGWKMWGATSAHSG